jgi:hypothetical protein
VSGILEDMSELPGTDELPRSTEGYDPARVEEAFALFADRVRELEDVADELRTELRALRAERAPSPRPPTVEGEHWPADADASPDWIAAVPAPLVRPTAVPRLALEGAFLLLVALFAGLADLSAPWIVLVMVTAWALVVAGEWAAAAKRARWRLDEIAPAVVGGAAETTGPWDMPVVEATVVETGPDPESQTVVTKLPAEPDEPVESVEPVEPDEPAASEQPEPAQRRGLFRRRKPVQAAAADPWET